MNPSSFMRISSHIWTQQYHSPNHLFLFRTQTAPYGAPVQTVQNINTNRGKNMNDNWYDPSGWVDASNDSSNPFIENVPENSSYNKHSSLNKKEEDILSNPVSIYNHFKKHIYKQDEYIRNLALFLFNHINGRTSILLATGPPGNGKSFAAEKLQELYPSTIIWDSSTLSKDGWSGSNKIQDILKESLKYKNPIIVLDEFDKMCQPQFSHNTNISLAMQAEFLKLFEGSVIPVKSANGSYNINTQKYSWLLLGSFSNKADELAENNSSSGIGFESLKNEHQPYDQPLTIKDLTDYGMIKEIASRITKICHTEPLTCDDYYYLLTKNRSSLLKEVEKKYGFPLNLSDNRIRSLADECFKNGLGIRSITHKLTCIADEQLFEQFRSSNIHETGENLNDP